jgi:hypothetical protein
LRTTFEDESDGSLLEEEIEAIAKSLEENEIKTEEKKEVAKMDLKNEDKHPDFSTANAEDIDDKRLEEDLVEYEKLVSSANMETVVPRSKSMILFGQEFEPNLSNAESDHGTKHEVSETMLLNVTKSKGSLSAKGWPEGTKNKMRALMST